MSAETPGPNDHIVKVYWRKFRTWRGARPFWAGLLTIFGGIPIAYFPYANMKLGNLTLAMQTQGGSTSAIIGVLLITLGLTMWFHHIVRVFAGVAAIILGLVSFPLSNLGGFFIGLLFSLIGGGLAIAWAPGEPEAGTAGQPEPGTAAHTRDRGDADQHTRDHGGADQHTRDHGGAGPTLETNGGRHSAG